MAPKLPKVPETDSVGKASAFVQLLAFVFLFLLIYLPLRRIVHAWYLRALILLLDYFIVSMITYLVIRPAAVKLEQKIRKK